MRIRADYTHAGFADYGNDQMTIYTTIVDAIRRVRGLVSFDLVISAGTATQNSRTSIVGDHFCRDWYHLDLNIRKYTVACSQFESILKRLSLAIGINLIR